MNSSITAPVMEPSIYEHHDPVEFLNATLLNIQEKNESFSMRSWAKQLGLSHVAMLSMVLRRKRSLLPSLSSKISEQFRKSGRFSENEARYFDMLVLFANAKSVDEKNFYQGILSNLKPDQTFSTYSFDAINATAEWYHSAILEMTYLKNFKSDPRWICLRLGDNVNESQVKAAIERLLRLGLLEKNKNGRLTKSSAQLATPSDIPNQSLRKFHAQMISKAAKALETQGVDERDITSTTVSINTDRIPEAKKMIRDFRRKLTRFLADSEGDAVYQLNLQLFNLLEKEK